MFKTLDQSRNISLETQRAIYRLTEQAELVLQAAKSQGKANTQVQKAQEICEDIRKILQLNDEMTVCDLFELTVAPRLVRLAQELRLHKQLNHMRVGTILNRNVQPRVQNSAAASLLKAQTAKSSSNSQEGVQSILRDLRDMLK